MIDSFGLLHLPLAVKPDFTLSHTDRIIKPAVSSLIVPAETVELKVGNATIINEVSNVRLQVSHERGILTVRVVPRVDDTNPRSV